MTDDLEKTGLPATRSASSALSWRKSAAAKLRKRLNTKPSLGDIAKILAQLSAVYGSPRDRTPDMAEVMVSEWWHSMDFLPLEAVNAAVKEAVRTCKFWPTPAEIIKLAIEHQLELRSALEQTEILAHERPTLQLTRATPAEDIPFKPNSEQIARVSALVKGFKRDIGIDVITDRMDEWAPASQDPNVSDALKAVVQKQRQSL